jgi:hypothetical protein
VAHLIFRQVNSHRIDKNPPWTKLTTKEIFKAWANRTMIKKTYTSRNRNIRFFLQKEDLSPTIRIKVMHTIFFIEKI